MHAIARILFDGVIHNIQVSWVKLGVGACQRILQAGANDFGGTLMEETISRMAGAEWGIEMTPERFDDAIRAIGRSRRCARRPTDAPQIPSGTPLRPISVNLTDGFRQPD